MTTPTNAHRTMQNVIHRATQARRSGRWPDWKWHDLSDGVPGTGAWAKEFRKAAENGVFAVLVRDLETAWGTVRHVMIADNVLGIEPTWTEKQRIKNELFGRETQAVEVFPKQSELVDQANAYHLWLMPPGFSLPFTLHVPPTEAPPCSSTDG